MDLKGIRIVSDGTVTGTRIYGADGEDVTAKLKVRKISWSHKAGDVPIATLDCTLAAIETALKGEDVQTLIETTDLSKFVREYELRNKPS